MNFRALPMSLSLTVGIAIWAGIILLPLVILYTGAMTLDTTIRPEVETGSLIVRSLVLAAVIAGTAVVLGYVPGRILGGQNSRQGLLLFLFLMPMMLPRYVLYYAWRLLQTPTTELGRFLSSQPDLAKSVGATTICMVMILWYWPLASLLIAQGWRSIDRQALDCGRLDAPPVSRFWSVTFPLLRRSLVLAFGVCFVFALGEFGTFHLAGVRTLGTEINDLYILTNSDSYAARAAWPLAGLAVVMGVMLWRRARDWTVNVQAGPIEIRSSRKCWAVLVVLLAFSLGAPLALLVGHVRELGPLQQFWKLHSDELFGSLVTAALGAVIALLMAGGALGLERFGRAGRTLSAFMQITILMAMFLPGSLVAVAVLKMLGEVSLTADLRQGWYVVSAGLAGRFAGVALILLRFGRDTHRKHLSEMAALDGASWFQTWRLVHLPRTWPLWLGALVLGLMLGMTELPATTLLLPAGVPNFAQQLLNQMHYMRDQQVIASCLMLMGVYLVLAVVVVGLLRVIKARSMVLLFLGFMFVCPMGCDFDSPPTGEAEVLAVFGKTGRGGGQFIYPRAIDIAPDGSLFVADKTGLIQRLTPQGEYLSSIRMPQIENGYTTGISFGADGNLYVADTHYYRVMVFTPAGKEIGQFGRLGQNDGEFIYPTDVAFSGEGRVFVSEYGGNDRISVFSSGGQSAAEAQNPASKPKETATRNRAFQQKQWKFLYSFGTLGSGEGELSRPSALCVDRGRGRLYVADACNHRIAVYDYDGRGQGYFGSVGRAPGQMRYPYDLALLADGTLVVCEYGNNRVQLFNPDGESIGVYGRGGRRSGELAYPWGVAVDDERRCYVVDAGNNRIQVWQL